MVKSVQTQSGIPVAFLLTRSPKTPIVANWLIALTNDIRRVFQKDYHPDVVIMDMGIIEYNAVSLAFPNARIFYCAFHVLQAWNRHMSDANLGITGADERTKKTRRVQVRIQARMLTVHHHRSCVLQTSIDCTHRSRRRYERSCTRGTRSKLGGRLMDSKKLGAISLCGNNIWLGFTSRMGSTMTTRTTRMLKGMRMARVTV